MKRFRTLDEMVEAIKRNELPQHIVSPGAVSAALGITRQSVHELCKRGTLPAWYAERVILIDGDAANAYMRKKLGLPEQGDLYATK